jgi:hypothetical protein
LTKINKNIKIIQKNIKKFPAQKKSQYQKIPRPYPTSPYPFEKNIKKYAPKKINIK